MILSENKEIYEEREEIANEVHKKNSMRCRAKCHNTWTRNFEKFWCLRIKCEVKWSNARTKKELIKCKLWMLFIVFGYLISLSEGYNKNIDNDVAYSDKQGQNDSPFRIFGHTLRVQRGVKQNHHNNRHFRNRHIRTSGKSSKLVTQCPPPMTRLPDDACTVDPCESDQECRGNGRSCCYNGCIYTCTDVVHPPPIIDWQTRNGKSKSAIDDVGENDEYEGNMEFEILPGEMLAEAHHGAPSGEICSTTVEEGDILLDCPHEYICHIENNGNPSLGIPNIGKCVAVDDGLLERPVSSMNDDDYSY